MIVSRLELRLLVGLFLLLFSLTSCGYRWGQGDVLLNNQAIFVPYIENDKDGRYTAALVRTLSQQSRLIYSDCSATFLLKVKLLDFYDVDIGFRYDRNKCGEYTKSVIPDETRLSVDAEVQLVEIATGKCLLGPVIINAEVDFDHDYYSARTADNVFSLGQLSDYDAAYDAAHSPLSKCLSRKILDFINANW